MEHVCSPRLAFVHRGRNPERLSAGRPGELTGDERRKQPRVTSAFGDSCVSASASARSRSLVAC